MLLRSTTPLVVSVLFLFLAGGQALIGQPPSIASEIETVLAAARTAASPGELEAARVELLTLAKRHPRDLLPAFPDRGRALLEAAALGRRLGATNAAAGELLQVLEREPESDWTPRAHLELADVLLDRDDWRLAAGHLRQARAAALARIEGEIPGAGNVDGSGVDVARLALERMTRIHRLLLRPLAGRSPWTRSGIHLPSDYLPEPLKLKRPRTAAAGPRGELLAADGDRVVLLDPDRKTVASRELRGIVRASLVTAGPVGGSPPTLRHRTACSAETQLARPRPSTSSGLRAADSIRSSVCTGDRSVAGSSSRAGWMSSSATTGTGDFWTTAPRRSSGPSIWRPVRAPRSTCWTPVPGRRRLPCSSSGTTGSWPER